MFKFCYSYCCIVAIILPQLLLAQTNNTTTTNDQAVNNPSANTNASGGDNVPVQNSINTENTPTDDSQPSSLLSGIQNRISDLQNQVSDINVYLSSLQVKLNDLIDHYSADDKNGNNLNDAQQKINDLQKKVMNTDTSLQNIKSELDTMAKKIDSLKSEHNPSQPETDNVSSRLSELENRMTSLEEAVKNAIGIEDGGNKNDSNTASDELRSDLEDESNNGDVNISNENNIVKIDLKGKILFNEGEVSLSKDGQKVLDKVAPVLKKLKNKIIMVIGHADKKNIGPNLGNFYPTNWELSTTRGTMVVRYLTEHSGIDPHMLMAAGRSFYDPSSDQKERRAEIWILPQLKSDM